MEDLLVVMKAVLLVQLQLLVAPEDREKPEIILHKAGFGAQEIGQFLGKTTAAVQKTLQRAR